VRTWIILNPKAGSGRALRSGMALKKRLPDATLVETARSGEACDIARRAREAGVDLVIPVGGDGTIQQCVAGLTLSDEGEVVQHATRMALLPAGTGGDYRKSFGFNDSLDHAEARIRSPNTRLVDVGLLKYQTEAGPATTAFANVMSFGLGGLTDKLVENGPKWLGGRVAFFLGALKATAIHQPIPIELTLDGQKIESAPYSNVAVCLGQYFGGGMKIAPNADPSDGLFDIVTMEMSKLQTTTLTGHIYRGTHLDRAGVHHYRGRVLEARPTREGESLIDADGEQLGSLPLKASVLPSALELLT